LHFRIILFVKHNKKKKSEKSKFFLGFDSKQKANHKERKTSAMGSLLFESSTLVSGKIDVPSLLLLKVSILWQSKSSAQYSLSIYIAV
jgi:hypothetical protein